MATVSVEGATAVFVDGEQVWPQAPPPPPPPPPPPTPGIRGPHGYATAGYGASPYSSIKES